MRLSNYLNEDDIQKGLSVDEPESGGKYSDDVVKINIKIVEKALSIAKKQEDSEANNAIVADLEDKLDKWKNVDKETKPAGPSVAAEILVGLKGEDAAAADTEKPKKDKEEE